MPSCYSIGVQDRYDVEDSLVPEGISNNIVFGQLINNSCHHMRAGNFPRMNSGRNDDAFFVTIKCLRFGLVHEQVLVVYRFLFVN